MKGKSINPVFPLIATVTVLALVVALTAKPSPQPSIPAVEFSGGITREVYMGQAETQNKSVQAAKMPERSTGLLLEATASPNGIRIKVENVITGETSTYIKQRDCAPLPTRCVVGDRVELPAKIGSTDSEDYLVNQSAIFSQCCGTFQ